MATTEGFGISALPQFTPVDPQLVAKNPLQLAHGMAEALKLKQSLQEVEARRAQQDFVAATQAARIAQTNALAGIDVNTAAGKTASTNALSNINVATAPSTIASDIATNLAQAKKAGPLANLELDRAAAATKDLAFNEKIRNDIETSKTIDAQAIAQSAFDRKRLTVDSAKLEADTLKEKYDLQQQLTKANIDYTKARAELDRAQADAASKGKPTDHVLEMSRYATMINALRTRIQAFNNILVNNPDTEAGGKVNLAQYEQIIRGGAPEGEVNKFGGVFGFGQSSMAKDLTAEAALAEIADMNAEIEQYKQMQGAVAQGLARSVSPAPLTSPQTVVPQTPQVRTTTAPTTPKYKIIEIK